MTSIAAPAATWGIPGSTFLWVYAGLAALSLVAVLVLRHRAVRGDRDPDRSRRLSPPEAAYLNGGEGRAVDAALVALRAARAIDTDSGSRLKQSGPVPAEATPLERAVHHALGATGQRSSLLSHRSVRAELDTLESGLVRAGLLNRPEDRRRARTAVLWLLPVLALGVIRILAGMANGRPVGYLVLLVLAVGVVTVVLAVRKPRRQTAAGASLLQKAYAEHKALRPSMSPSLATYGAMGAGMAVALWGTSSLYRQDPTFAAAAGMPLTATGGGGYTSSGSSSCGSSSSCGGGGGGCGGGGCGG